MSGANFEYIEQAGDIIVTAALGSTIALTGICVISILCGLVAFFLFSYAFLAEFKYRDNLLHTAFYTLIACFTAAAIWAVLYTGGGVWSNGTDDTTTLYVIAIAIIFPMVTYDAFRRVGNYDTVISASPIIGTHTVVSVAGLVAAVSSSAMTVFTALGTWSDVGGNSLLFGLFAAAPFILITASLIACYRRLSTLRAAAKSSKAPRTDKLFSWMQFTLGFYYVAFVLFYAVIYIISPGVTGALTFDNIMICHMVWTGLVPISFALHYFLFDMKMAENGRRPSFNPAGRRYSGVPYQHVPMPMFDNQQASRAAHGPYVQ